MIKKTSFIIFFHLLLLDISAQQLGRTYINKYLEADYFLFEDTKQALDILLELHHANMDNANINFLIGASYMNIKDFENAYPFLIRAMPYVSPEYTQQYSDTTASMYTHYYLGIIHQKNYRFDEAIYHFNIFKYYIKSDYANQTEYNEVLEDLNHWIATSHNAKKHLANSKDILIENIGLPVNTKYPEYAPVVSSDGKKLFFTSRRPENIGRRKDIDGLYFEDIYKATYDEDLKKWSNVQNLGRKVNSRRHEAALSLSHDGTQLFIYKDNWGVGNIYVSNYKNGAWGKPKKLNINSRYWESHASLSPDGETLFFSSNRPGGYGGTDIYKSYLLPDGKWSEPENLGPIINSEFDEDTPSMLEDGKTLFFASKGHNSMGGFDVFSSVLSEDGTWSTPKNMGFPINTTGDDLFYYPTSDPKVYYYSFSSNEGYGNMDIYKVTILDEKPIAAILKGNVVDKLFLRPVNATFTLTNTDTNTEYVFETYKETGEFYKRLGSGNKYKLSISARGYEPFAEIVDANNLTTDKVFEKNYFLLPERDALLKLGYNDKQINELALASTDNLTEISVGNKIMFKNLLADTSTFAQRKASTINQYRDLSIAELRQTKKEKTILSELLALSKHETTIIKEEVVKLIKANLYYAVQIGAYSNQLSSTDLFGITPIEYEVFNENVFRHLHGKFTSLKEAKAVKDNIVNKGIDDAFVVAYYNNTRISIEAALSIEEESTTETKSIIPKEIIKELPIKKEPEVKQKTTLIEKDSVKLHKDSIINIEPKDYNLALYYTIQVGVYYQKRSSEELFNLSPLNYEQIDGGLFRHLYGNYNSYEEAKNKKNTIILKGIDDAFVVAYLNGKRIPVSEARQNNNIKKTSTSDTLQLIESFSKQKDDKKTIYEKDEETISADDILKSLNEKEEIILKLEEGLKIIENEIDSLEKVPDNNFIINKEGEVIELDLIEESEEKED